MDVRAEWPGVVREIHVAVGATVAADDELVTLESMKMLTPVLAPSAGQISDVVVAVDDYVEAGATLVRIA